MAGILSLLGEPVFWEFNVLEVFASLAILIGVGWAIKGHFKERSRRNRLIIFPDTWTATRRLPQEKFEVRVNVDIYLPHYSSECELYMHYEGTEEKQLEFEPLEMTQPSAERGKGRLRVVSNIPLSPLLNKAEEVELWVKLTLDGDFSKKSKKRIVPITDIGVALSTPDTEGSRTE